MCMEDKALKEINELKAQVNEYREKLNYISLFMLENVQYTVFNKLYEWAAKTDDLLEKSPAQCLKQHDIELLNSIKDELINSNQSCELILASRINSLELDNEWVRKEKI